MKKLLGSRIAFPLIALALMAVTVCVGLSSMRSAISRGDSSWYVMMAEGRLHEVIEPYSARFLHPFLAGLASRLFSIDVTYGFLIVAVLSVLAFLLINGSLLKRTIRSPLLIALILFIPYLVMVLQGNIQPDALSLFLTALFFLLLFYEKEGAALVTLFLLFLSRETTILLGVILFVVSLSRSKKLLALGTLLVVILSFFVSGSISGIGEPNTHDLNPLVFMALKFPYHTLVNGFGMRLWVTGYDFCEPLFKMPLPPLEVLGSIREVGFCGFDASVPLRSFIALLGTFGVMPLAFVYIFAKKGWRLMKTLPFWFPVAVAYGIAMYAVSLAAGTGVPRIVGYAWPVFLLATPFLIAGFVRWDKKFVMKLAGAHVVAAWTPFVMQGIGDFSSVPVMALTLGIILAAYGYAFRLLKRQAPLVGGAGLSADRQAVPTDR